MMNEFDLQQCQNSSPQGQPHDSRFKNIPENHIPRIYSSCVENISNIQFVFINGICKREALFSIGVGAEMTRCVCRCVRVLYRLREGLRYTPTQVVYLMQIGTQHSKYFFKKKRNLQFIVERFFAF